MTKTEYLEIAAKRYDQIHESNKLDNFYAEWELQTGHAFTDNINVLVNVSVDYYTVYGLLLQVNDIDPNFTLGVLAQQKQATLDRSLKRTPVLLTVWAMNTSQKTRS